MLHHVRGNTTNYIQQSIKSGKSVLAHKILLEHILKVGNCVITISGDTVYVQPKEKVKVENKRFRTIPCGVQLEVVDSETGGMISFPNAIKNYTQHETARLIRDALNEKVPVVCEERGTGVERRKYPDLPRFTSTRSFGGAWGFIYDRRGVIANTTVNYHATDRTLQAMNIAYDERKGDQRVARGTRADRRCV